MNIRLRRIAYLLVLGTAIAFFSEQHSCAAPSLAWAPAPGEWQLTVPPRCAPPRPADLQVWAGTRGARLVCRAQYGGAPALTLTLYEMPGTVGATAFDAFQRWRRQPGKMGFYKGHYFGVVESTTADSEEIDRFTAAAISALPGGAGLRQ